MKIKVCLMAVIALLAASFTASAATVFEKDGTKLSLKGDYQIQLRQDIGEDEDLYVDYDDLTVTFDAKQELDYGWTAFGVLKMDWKGQAHGDADNAVDEGFVGVDFGMVSVSMGRLDWGSDDFEVEEAIEFDGGYAVPEEMGSDSFRVDVDLDVVKAALSGDLEVEDNESAAEAYIYTGFKGLEAGVLYQNYKDNADADSLDTIGVRAGYDFGPVYLGADYTTNDNQDNANAVVVVPILSKTKIALGYGLKSPDAADEDDVNSWYANVVHKLGGGVSVHAEIGDTDEDGTDMGYLAGLRFKF